MKTTRKILAIGAVGILAAFFAPGQQDDTSYADENGGYAAPTVPPPQAAPAGPETGSRSAYTYLRDVSGEVTVISPMNGSVAARRNLPISTGDELKTDDPGRAEVALADGNVLHVGGGTDVKFSSLSEQQGSDDQVSAIELSEGSVILAVMGSEGSAPRIDTDDATIYGTEGARVRVNADVRRGTSVVVRAGSVEVKSRTGSYTVRTGNYLLVQGDQEPEIARGSFSRDRFDLWAADRLETTYDNSHSASTQYVGEDYAGDVSSLDGYGNWDYSQDDGYVWRPNVDTNWSPYSNGNWYSTPVGLSWWSWDPWGWYPFHYGSWFYNAGWCWSPGYVYSPAWVYWGYSGGYFGWCPVGYYSHGHGGHGGHGWDGGHNGGHGGNWGHGGNGGHNGPGGSGGPGGGGNGGNARQQVAYAINGRFPTRNVDMRGWNFTNTANVGTLNGRLAVTNGTRLSGRLGDELSVSSRPIVVDRGAATGGPTAVRAALQDHLRSAPQTIARSSGNDSQLLGPVLAGQRNLSRETVDALDRRTMVAERGRVSGPGASDMAPRGAPVVDRGRTTAPGAASAGPRIATDRNGRTTITDRAPATTAPERGTVTRPGARANDPRIADSWRNTSPDARGRSFSRQGPGGGTLSDREVGRPGVQRPDVRRPDAAPSDSWRGRAPRSADAGPERRSVAPPSARSQDSWRGQSSVPPARRVIEGSVPNRRVPEGAPDVRSRSRDSYAPYRSPGGEPRYDTRREISPREQRLPRSMERPQRPDAYGYDSPRQYSAPQQMPRTLDRGPAPAPAPRSAPPSYSAPRYSAPPRSAPAPAPRSAPAPSGSSRSNHRGRS
jgi:hypothetical protein